jgi:hypothetical protein
MLINKVYLIYHGGDLVWMGMLSLMKAKIDSSEAKTLQRIETLNY